jgi:CO/xanthine dehydrogenase Mo-binding subunit
MTDLPRPIAARYIGQSVPRQEDRRLLTGHGCYVDDVRGPEQMVAAFVRSEVAAGRIQSVDISAAMALADVVAVLTGDDLDQDAGEMYWATTGPDMPMTGPLAPGRVSYVGDPIAAIGELDVVISTQTVHEERAFCSRMLNVPESRCTVSMRDVRGGFGSKMFIGREEAAVVLVAHRLGGSIKWIEDRAEAVLQRCVPRRHPVSYSPANS